MKSDVETNLINSASTGDLAQVQEIIAQNRVHLDNCGLDALDAACQNSQIEIIKYLCRQSQVLSAITPEKYAEIFSYLTTNLPALQIILGSALDASQNGESLLCAAFNKNKEIFKIKINVHGRTTTILIVAIRKNYISFAAELIAYLSVEELLVKDAYGKSALDYSVAFKLNATSNQLLHKLYGQPLALETNSLLSFDDPKFLMNGTDTTISRVTHKATRQNIVIKHALSTTSELFLLQEISILTKLGHPNIIKFQGSFVSPGLYLMLEYINGEDLCEFYNSTLTKLPEQEHFEIVQLIYTTLREVLIYIHGLEIIHLDIKDQNVMIEKGKDIRVVLIDFGLARTGANNIISTLIGTPGMVAPEIIAAYDSHKCIEVTGKCDVFSLGVVLYEAIMRDGEKLVLFAGENKRARLDNTIHQKPEWPQRTNLPGFAVFKDNVSKFLIKDPKERPSAHEIPPIEYNKRMATPII